MIRKSVISSALIFAISFSFVECQNDDPWHMVQDILSRISPPQIPDRRCNILDFNAVRSPNDDDVEAPPSTVDANTNAFKNAIQSCHDLGGGTVYVPEGTYITSAITLLSNISLEVSSGAIIRFTRDTTKYPIVFTRWEGIELMNYSPFIYAFEAENIAITGSGIIDGNCDCEHWWPWKGTWSRQCWVTVPENQTNARNALFQMAEDNVPVEQRVFGEGHFLRPQFIQPYRSKNVLIENVTILNSPMWIVHPVLCENVIVRNINITSLGPNSDGVDPESCKDVWIYRVYFQSGDDDIAIKSGRNADGRRINVPSENIVIQNCTMADGHGGITLGSCISGGVRNIFAENCYLDSPNLDTAIRVKNNALRGGLLEKFYLRNIRVGQVAKQVVEVDFYYEEGPNADFVPVLKEVFIDNVNVTGGAPYSMVVKGYPSPNSSYIEMTLSNINFAGLKNTPHYIVENVDSINFSEVKVQIWQQWNTTDESSSAQSFGASALIILGITIFFNILVSLN
ncbi:putative polygalacturonase [Pseudolycoriella hygida]|uniref:Polygalacturonase n=1 Tax=Pseudolycoriella hygida TaxID=35572 RepID=A0A9Q0N4U4_9DIPT|nr:putative polygalacturonase [Pseudolycoriella hygida]